MTNPSDKKGTAITFAVPYLDKVMISVNGVAQRFGQAHY